MGSFWLRVRARCATVQSDPDGTIALMIVTSIVFTPTWNRIKPYLHIVDCAQDGGVTDPRIRIEFLGLPEQLAAELVHVEMPCVECRRPNHPLRHREGDDWTRLYYAPTCPITIRMRCARGRSAELEYERFKGLDVTAIKGPPPQLSLF